MTLICESSPDLCAVQPHQSDTAGIFITVSKVNSVGEKSEPNSAAGVSKPKRTRSGPLTFFILVIIVALGSIQLVSTFHSYALGLAELNGLKKQESALIARKAELQNDIDRWDDKAYVTAQARDRLGFVFPGEQAVTVLHSEAVTGQSENQGEDRSQQDVGVSTMPWYVQINDALSQADKTQTEIEAGEQ